MYGEASKATRITDLGEPELPPTLGHLYQENDVLNLNHAIGGVAGCKC
jgi:hypothetical protein